MKTAHAALAGLAVVAFMMGCDRVLAWRQYRPVYVLAVGSRPSIRPEEVVAFCRQALHIPARSLGTIPFPPAAGDRRRRQLVAEEVVASIKHDFPEVRADSDAIVIAVTDADMYAWESPSRFVFSYRFEDQFAVISGARMDPKSYGAPPDPSLLWMRMRKMIAHDLGALYFRLSLSESPSSVMYRHVQFTQDLDKIADGFVQSDLRGPVAPTSRQPCLIVAHKIGDARQRADWGMIGDCAPGALSDLDTELFEVDLRHGTLIERRTDFYVTDSLSVEFARFYDQRIAHPEAFGVGATFGFDWYLWSEGRAMQWVDLVIADGTRVRYVRTSPGVGFRRDLVLEHSGPPNGFEGSKLIWDRQHFSIVLADQSALSFAQCRAAGSTCRLDGIEPRGGPKLEIARDEMGHAREIRSARTVLRLESDESGRIVRADDGVGRAVTYRYDDAGHLVTVTPSDRPDTVYRYLDDGTVAAVLNGDHAVLTNTYQDGRIVEQRLGDGQTFRIRYEAASDGTVREVRVERPEGGELRLRFSPARATLKRVGENGVSRRGRPPRPPLLPARAADGSGALPSRLATTIDDTR